jgi:N-acetyl sugar amidotransferase
MKYCKRCITPDSRPNIRLDKDGICGACRNFETRKAIDWSAREESFRELAAHAKESNRGSYDCMIPVSGGKDSTWQIVKCLSYGLRILAYTWRPPGRTALGQANLDNLIRLGVDHVDYSVNPGIEKRYTLASFRKYGTNAIPMHFGIYSVPLRLAVQMGIPLIIYGENSAFEYGNPEDARVGYKIDENWLHKYGVTNGTTIKDWIGVEGLTERDLASYSSPALNDVEHAGVRAVFLGYYFPWDPQMSLEVAMAHGFKSDSAGPRTGYYNFADIDDDFISIHHWMKWYKFGFTRLFDNLSLEIRNGRMRRERAVEIIAEYGDQTPYGDIEKLCAYMGITTAHFFEIAETFRGSNVWQKRDSKWVIDGFLVRDWKW